MITKKRLKLKRGDDHAFRITLNQEDVLFDVNQIQRVDLQAVTKWSEVLNISTENGLIEMIGDGQILLNIPHYLTQNEKWLTADYDMQITFSDGRVKTVLEGVVELSHDITQVRLDRTTYQSRLQANTDIAVEIEPVIATGAYRQQESSRDTNKPNCSVEEPDFPDLLNIYNNAKS